MRLSIITINYNNLAGLQKTIESVVSQTFRDFEWIVIDGGSVDGSRELIERYTNSFSYWVSEPDKGIYNAMNKGIVVAKGDYLLFLNSGDWLCDEMALERSFSHHPTKDIVYGDLFFVENNSVIGERRYPKELSLRFFYQSTICHNASFIRRELFQKELYDEHYRIASDWVFFLKQALINASFEYLGEIVLCYDTSGISTINKELVKQEREVVLKEFIPEMLVRDFNAMSEMEATLNRDQVKKVIHYGGKSKFYHKLITGALLLIGFLEKFARKDD